MVMKAGSRSCIQPATGTWLAALHSLPDHPLKEACKSLILAVPRLGARQVRQVPLGSPRTQWPQCLTGHVIMTVTSRLQNKEHMTKPYACAIVRFSGHHQKSNISKKRDFAKFNKDKLDNMVADKWLIPSGYRIKYTPSRYLLIKC